MNIYKLLLIGLPIVTACSAQNDALDEAALLRLFSHEQTLFWSGYGYQGDVQLRLDGTATITIPRLGMDRGRWWLSNDLICSQWQKAIKGVKRCAKIAPLSEDLFEVRDATLNVRLGKFSTRPLR